MPDITWLENSNICEVLSAFASLSHSSTTAIRGIESGTFVLVIYQCKLKKKSLIVITCNLRCASSDSQTVRNGPVVLLATLNIYSRKRFKKAQRSVFTET